MNVLPDGSAFFVMDVETDPNVPRPDPVMWNPWNKVVQDHRDGTIHHDATNEERARRNLPTPWAPIMGDIDVRTPPIF